MRLIPFVLMIALVAGCSDRSASVVGPSPASALALNASSGAPGPVEDAYVSESCGFDVRVDLSGKEKEIALPGGRFKLLFPAFTTTLTNLGNGKQITLSTTGSFHIRERGDNLEIVYTGRNSFDDPFAGELLLLIGNFREVFGPDGQPLDGNGQIVDLCEALS